MYYIMSMQIFQNWKMLKIEIILVPRLSSKVYLFCSEN